MKKTTLKVLLGFSLFFPILIFGQANDDFANAEPISCGSNYTGSTVAATLDEDSAPDGFGADMDAQNVWYSYTGNGVAETVTLNLCNSAYDTSVLIYTGTSGNLTLVGGNDDDATCGALLGTRSRASFNSDGTTTYYIAIEGWNFGTTGTYTMDVTCAATTPPAVANQTCDTALELVVDTSSAESDNSFGTVNPIQNSCDLFGGIQDVWFSFTAPSETVDCIVTPITMTSANFSVYSGDCTALTSLTCSSNLTEATKESLTDLTPGATYHVQVWSNGAEQGTFSISLSDPSVCLPVATFEKISNCPVDSDFSVTVDLTSLASATSVTVADNQGNSQVVTATGLLTFGPYTTGTSVVVTVTNDQSPTCVLTSTAQTQGPCPQANDECSNAVTIACGDTLSNQTTEGATGGTGTSCVGTIGDDVWYTLTGDDQIYTLTATSTNGEGPQVEVYESTDGTCAGFAAGTCYAFAGTGETETVVNFTADLGTVYYVHIGNWINGDPAVVFDLALTCEAPATPPANDDSCGAYVVTVNPDLSCASVTSGTVAGATASGIDEAACGGTEDDDVWFSFVAADTRHTISLTNVDGSTTDLYHSLWSGDCNGLSLVTGSCSDPESSIQNGLNVGETYFVRVYSYTGNPLQDTTFDLCIGTLPPPPANDDCLNATELTVGNEFGANSITGSTIAASATSGLTFACQTNRTNDAWYNVTVPASGLLTLETDAASGTAMTDSVLSVFSGSCGSLTEIGCNDDDGNGNFSKVELTGLTPGDVLYVGVWRYGTGNDGEFLISAYDTTLATSTFDNAAFAYYPNPVNNVLNLSYAKVITNVAVFNLLGQEVMTKALNSNLSQIDMSHLTSGTYMVKVTADNQVKTIKIIKQ